MITGEVIGAEMVSAKLRKVPMSVRQQLVIAVRDSGLFLANYIKQKKLSGQMLNVRSDKLRSSVISEFTDAGNEVYSLVGPGPVAYARIHEFGGQTKAHEIVAKNGKMLHFVSGGLDIFRKSVHHPGSKMPERSYLRSSLFETREQIARKIEEAIKNGIDKA